MADFQIPDKTLLTAVDRAVDSWLIYDNSATALKRTTAKYALDLTSHPVGVDDTQTLTAKTLTSPTINGATLSGTLAGTYTIGGTPTFPSSVVTLTGSQTLTNKVLTSPTINSATITNPTLAVDTVSEHTAANGVTIDSLNIKDGKLNTNDSVVTANITNSAVTTAKIADGSVTNAKLATSAGEVGGAWVAWTPAWTNLTVGAGGTNTGYYTTVGKTVKFRVFFQYGTGSAVGTLPKLTLPVASVNYVAGYPQIGNGVAHDNGGVIYPLMCAWLSTTTAGLFAENSSATYVGHTSVAAAVPFTFASGDYITIIGEYEKA